MLSNEKPTDFKSQEMGTSVYTARIVDRVTICDQDSKEVTQIRFELGRPVNRDRLDVG